MSKDSKNYSHSGWSTKCERYTTWLEALTSNIIPAPDVCTIDLWRQIPSDVCHLNVPQMLELVTTIIVLKFYFSVSCCGFWLSLTSLASYPLCCLVCGLIYFLSNIFTSTSLLIHANSGLLVGSIIWSIGQLLSSYSSQKVVENQCVMSQKCPIFNAVVLRKT